MAACPSRRTVLGLLALSLTACAGTAGGTAGDGWGEAHEDGAGVEGGGDGDGDADGADGDADGPGDAAGDETDGGEIACMTDEECDDGIDCTTDACDVALHICLHVADDALCDDGSPCTVGERCDERTGCIPGSPRDCNDDIFCTSDECMPLTGECVNTPVHERCASPEMCLPALGGCAVPPPCASDGECDDGNACNGAETCDPTRGCQPGEPVDCDDDVLCTADVCDPATGACAHAPEDWRCEDGNACNGHESCDAALGCRPGTPVNCSDGVSCTDDSCDVATGNCTHVPNDRRCDDGVFCNGPERCDPAAGCASGAVPACSDGIGCTRDACDPVTDSCVHVPDDALCTDGQFCNGAEICVVGVGCGPGRLPVCDDGLACTTDRCDPAAAGGAGACVGIPPDRDGDTYGDAACTGTDCDDGSAAIHPGASEACNGVDDDCDGTTDETFSCPRGQVRSCTVPGGCTGAQTCDAACNWGACIVSTTEMCNGVDDNCNGVADEGFACVRGAVQACMVGACPGFQTCGPSCTWGACTASASEVCNGVDDDCDGLTDEGFTCAVGRTQSCTLGSCTGTQTCTAGCAWGPCTVSTPEACNGIDDNCNGATDETFTCRLGATAGCTNSCGVSGTQTCVGPSCTWGACCAATEVCGNSCDDNCNGSVNEGCCVGGTYNFTFPNTGDARGIVYYPYMWNAGDYWQGTRTASFSCATSVTFTLYADVNYLSCDVLPLRVLINGIVVGTFNFPAGVAATTQTFSFSPIYGPTFTFRIEATRTVASGCGSVAMRESYSPWTLH